MSTPNFIESIEDFGNYSPSDSDTLHPLTLNALLWARRNFDASPVVTLPDTEDLSPEEITSIRIFYSGSEKLNHYDNLSDLLKKLKK